MIPMPVTSMPKFKRLCKALSLPAPHALGHLCMLWDYSSASGEVAFPQDDIELIAEWDGEKGALLDVLIDQGWLYELADGAVEMAEYWDSGPVWHECREC